MLINFNEAALITIISLRLSELPQLTSKYALFIVFSISDKAIVFLTDGLPPPGTNKTILKKIADLTKPLGNKVIIMTYGLGTGNSYHDFFFYQNLKDLEVFSDFNEV